MAEKTSQADDLDKQDDQDLADLLKGEADPWIVKIVTHSYKASVRQEKERYRALADS